MKILLVDDDVFLRDMYATKFKELGHDIVTAESGTRALELLKEKAFDVIVLDMIMPGMSGIEVLNSIQSLKITPQPISIILSNQGGSEEIDAAKAAGASGYIIKAELIPSEVVAEVERIISK